jgi:hypothetical protein
LLTVPLIQTMSLSAWSKSKPSGKFNPCAPALIVSPRKAPEFPS